MLGDTSRGGVTVALSVVALLAGAAVPGARAASGERRMAVPVAPSARCSPGAHTLSRPGAHVYPDTGNGGYTSLHTDLHLVYDATSNRFLTGNHVVLTDRATRCLTSFSLDLERRSLANRRQGPDLHVRSVTVDGHAASFRFVRPTYAGDPKGQNDPNPRAHQASQQDPVGGPHHNRLPPACSPELTASKPNAQDGQRCPRNKLVITPRHRLAKGSLFTVTVRYTGRPGVHTDGDGSTEGWFRSSDGGFVTTEPVGTEDWMPLNDYPTAKPTYDFYDTVNAGKTAVANGVLESARKHKPDAEFPGGSTTWHWHSRAPIASYLVESSVGDYHLTERTADNGIRYYQVQDRSISPARQKQNLAVMKQQEDITEFESLFNGAYPFTSDGILIGTPPASFEEEMQTMITFAGGEIDLDTLYHENMHQWWGDHVSEGSYAMTFFKEGLATLGEYLFAARQAETAAGGGESAAGQAAFQSSLVRQFRSTYASDVGFWAGAPSNPTPFSLFSSDSTYQRPGAAYIALRQILGSTNFVQALQGIQTRYGGRSITEPQLEAGFARWLPVPSPACSSRLGRFFRQWFDTAYPSGGRNRPRITGPGLPGHNFYGAGGCVR